MRVWLLQGRQGEDPGGLLATLRQWAGRPANATWHLDVHTPGPELAARVQAHRPEVLVFAAALLPARSRVEEMLALDVGLIVAAEEGQADAFHDLAERHPVLFVSAQPTAEMLGLALHGARAALRREQHWKTQVEQLHQRLNDRIVIERTEHLG